MTFKATLIRADENGFKWIVSINGQDFEFFQGIGYGELKSGDGRILVPNASRELKIAVLKSHRPYDRLVQHDVDTCYAIFVNVPKQDDVLYCLFLDAEAHNQSFNDWCSDLGYDSDSIKAKKCYDACIDNYHKLAKALGPKYAEVKKSLEERNS